MSEPDRVDADRRGLLVLAAGGLALPLAGGSQAVAADLGGYRLGRGQAFDEGWRFYRGSGSGFEAPSFNDSAWRKVDLPHDWMIEDVPHSATGAFGPQDPASVPGAAQGYTVGGEGWYRRRFRLNGAVLASKVEICFEGAAVSSEVWLNGVKLGSHHHAYTPFSYDLTPHLVSGDNVIAVRTRNVGKTSRWYAGAGLYRAVTLDVFAGPLNIARWGVGASTRRIADGRAEILVSTQCEGELRGAKLRTRLLTPDGRTAAEAVSTAAVEVQQMLRVSEARLWSPDRPELYVLESAVLRLGEMVDLVRQPFGVRIVRMDATNGLTINGKHHVLRGGCVHHSNGLLGACAFPDADERRVLQLKARGFNAVRSSHNLSSPAFRDACDRHGMLLIEEAFDVWHAAKLPDDYHLHFREDWRDDLTRIVLRARNSPSVIMWSIGNEIPERSTPEGVEWSWKLANEVRRLDPTRPVTAAIHMFEGRRIIPGPETARVGQAGKAVPSATAFLDVVGYNYKLKDFERAHALYPDRMFYGSETYAGDTLEYVHLESRAPYVIGDFVWTAIDYIGEAGLGNSVWQRADSKEPPAFRTDFPWLLSNCGDIDLIGQQRPQSYARDVFWDVSALELLVRRPGPPGQVERVNMWGFPDAQPRWTWPGAEGRPLTVQVYSRGEKIELRLNGRLVAEQVLAGDNRMQASFEIPYEPGVLEAVSYTAGKVAARKLLRTAGKAHGVRVGFERRTGLTRRKGLLFAQLAVVDRDGLVVPDTEARIDLAIEGPVELVAFGNANPLGTGSLRSSRARTFNGRALAILRSTGRAGVIKVLARCGGLERGAASEVA